MIGYIKGYDISKITEKKANKKDFGIGIDSVISPKVLRENILDVLRNGGKIYGLYKKKELVACYIFKKEKTATSELTKPAVISLTKDNLSKIVQGKFDEISTEKNSDILKNEEITVFRFAESYVSPQHTAVTSQFEKAILDELKEYILFGEAKAVIWQENILVSTQFNMGALGSMNSILIGASIGFLMGLAFEDFLIGFLFMFIFALSFGTMFRSIYTQSDSNTTKSNANTDNTNTDNNISDK